MTLTFITDTMLPIEAAITMGVSVKTSSDAIGKFGTGLKYSIAGILRLRGSVTIFVGLDEHVFSTARISVRGKSFEVVHCNGVSCGFTTELGKHWEPWQYFRELASNTLDEGGSWTDETVEINPNQTHIVVDCREIEVSERNDAVFLGDNQSVLVKSSNGATIYRGPSRHYYFKGIRAGTFVMPCPVTVDVSDGELSEDRMLDMATVQSELCWAFRSATAWDEDFLTQVVAEDGGENSFFGRMLSYSLHDVPDDMKAWLMERSKWVKHPRFKLIIEREKRKNKKERWAQIPQTDYHIQLISEAEAVCAAINLDTIDRSKIRFTRELEDEVAAITVMTTREVWFSTMTVSKGPEDFIRSYVEEAVHLLLGAKAGHERPFIDMLLSLSINAARRVHFEERSSGEKNPPALNDTENV